MKRPVEERRRLLKTLLAGGAAVTAATALPDSWKKPLVDSVVTPLHAQGSAPAFIQTFSIAYTVSGQQPVSSTVTPATTPKTHIFNASYLADYNYSFVPTLTVQPGITDSFTLAVAEVIDPNGNQTNFTPSSQNLTPSVNTGVVPFVAITGSVDNAKYAQYQFTLTPTNPALPTYYLQVTLDEAPAGIGAGLP